MKATELFDWIRIFVPVLRSLYEVYKNHNRKKKSKVYRQKKKVIFNKKTST